MFSTETTSIRERADEATRALNAVETRLAVARTERETLSTKLLHAIERGDDSAADAVARQLGVLDERLAALSTVHDQRRAVAREARAAFDEVKREANLDGLLSRHASESEHLALRADELRAAVGACVSAVAGHSAAREALLSTRDEIRRLGGGTTESDVPERTEKVYLYAFREATPSAWAPVAPVVRLPWERR